MMQQMKTAQQEHVVRLFATSCTQSTLQYCFAVLSSAGLEARRQREIDEAQQKLDRARQSHNTQYELALRAWARTDAETRMHSVFSSWRSVMNDEMKRRDTDGMMQ